MSDPRFSARSASEPVPLRDFDFELPPERIAQAPVQPRDASRLIVVPRGGGEVEHRRFRDLPELLRPGDLLVVNRTRVLPARLHLHKPTGGRIELLLVAPVDGDVTQARTWLALGRPGRALIPGRRLQAPGGGEVVVVERDGQLARVSSPQPLWPLIEAHGEMPLPPYIHRDGDGNAATADAEHYQTIFAEELGAVAAPTAGLHFTAPLLGALEARGIRRAAITLHVGPGTFLPVRPELADDVRAHPMHAERYDVPDATAAAVEATRAAGGRVVAVGTTSVRTLEAWSATGLREGSTDLFIYPGFRFAAVDALITNFHLPRSTLLMLVCAFAGRERVLAAYRNAVREGYRFYSYGDAMLIA